MKGTPSMGTKRYVSHIRCRRCGRTSFNVQTSVCAACGYGKSAKIRSYNWQTHNYRRQRRPHKKLHRKYPR